MEKCAGFLMVTDNYVKVRAAVHGTDSDVSINSLWETEWESGLEGGIDGRREREGQRHRDRQRDTERKTVKGGAEESYPRHKKSLLLI